MLASDPSFPEGEALSPKGLLPTVTPNCESSSHILPSRPHMAHRFSMGIMGPDGLIEAWPQRPRFWPTGLCAAQRCPGGVQHTVATLGEEPSQGFGAQSHYALPGLLPLCSGWIAALSNMKHNLAVSAIMQMGGGGWLLHPLCRASLFLLKRVSGGCRANCKPKEAPAPGVGTSPAFSMGDVHHSSCASWVLRAPAASSKARGGRSDRLGPWWLPWAHELVAPRRGGLFSPQPSSLQVHSGARRTGPASSRPRRSFPRASSVAGIFRSAASSAAQGAAQGN